MQKQFRVLHVVSGEYKPGNGIYTVVNTLLENINKSDDINCSLLISDDFQTLGKYKVYSRADISFEKLMDKEKYELVVFHGIFFLNYLKDYKYALSKGIPYLIKPHSSLMKSSWDKGKLRKKIFYHFGLKNFLKQASGILFINDEERKNSFDFCRNSFIERNGINIDRSVIKKRPSDKVRFLFFSRIDFHHKGLDFLLNSLLLIKEKNISDDIEFSFFGPGKKKDIEKLKTFIYKNDLCFANYYGSVYGNEEKKSMFENSDIMILTSRYEGFPTVIAEALFVGVPPLVTPGTNSLFLTDDEIGWNCELNANAIADTIISASEEFNHSKDTISRKCISYASENFIMERSLEETKEIYNLFK